MVRKFCLSHFGNRNPVIVSVGGRYGNCSKQKRIWIKKSVAVNWLRKMYRLKEAANDGNKKVVQNSKLIYTHFEHVHFWTLRVSLQKLFWCYNFTLNAHRDCYKCVILNGNNLHAMEQSSYSQDIRTIAINLHVILSPYIFHRENHFYLLIQ